MIFWRPREECISRRSKWTSGLKHKQERNTRTTNRCKLNPTFERTRRKLNDTTRGRVANSSEIPAVGVC